jgi:hypothetical protein
VPPKAGAGVSTAVGALLPPPSRLLLLTPPHVPRLLLCSCVLLPLLQGSQGLQVLCALQWWPRHVCIRNAAIPRTCAAAAACAGFQGHPLALVLLQGP